MRKQLLHTLFFTFILTVLTGVTSPFSMEMSAQTKKRHSAVVANKTQSTSKAKKRTAQRRRGRNGLITTVYSNPATGEWIHRGKRKIVIHRDTADGLRAMTPFSAKAAVAKPYADIINQYAQTLKPHYIKVYSVIAPTQGEFYMPERITDNLSQKAAIEEWNKYLHVRVRPILVCDTLKAHADEDIYLHTDHHWAPLGAYYAAAKIARELGDSIFISLEECTPDTVKNFVGTMYNFSGDAQILKYPENFIYFLPPGNNQGEFIDYSLKANKVAYHETPPHSGPLFRKFHDGSRSAYSTFLGGDNHTVKTVNPDAQSPKKILLVKDSYGNALFPYLATAFQEVHIIDFRHFPHSLTDYIVDNGITDVIFVNCTELAFAPSTAQRLKEILPSKRKN